MWRRFKDKMRNLLIEAFAYFYSKKKFNNKIKLKFKNKNIIIRNSFYDKVILFEDMVMRQYAIPLKNYKPSVIFDVGAHIGTTTLFFRSTFPNSYIFSFEPVESNFELLKLNVKNDDKIKIFRKAITSKKGKMKITIDPVNTGGHSFSKQGNMKYEYVETTTINDVIRKLEINKIDILKIDAEGSEPDILMGISDNILLDIDVILLEYHSYEDKKFIKQFLSRHFVLVFEKGSRDLGILKFVNKKLKKNYSK